MDRRAWRRVSCFASAAVEGLRECLIADQSVTRFTSLSKKLP
jgi:hypothetical protein